MHRRKASVRRARASPETAKVTMNAWTVGLAGGLLEGAPIRLAAEIARVVDDGPNMHVLPIVTRGATENLNSLLYLRGVDTAIINSDALEEYKIQVPEIRRRITYLLNLFPSELHIFVRPEIQSLQDLAGKKVNFNTQGTAAAYSGPLIFSRLGVDVDKTFIPHQVALEQLRKGEMAAVVFITSKPVDAFLRGRWEAGFKFLPVTYDSQVRGLLSSRVPGDGRIPQPDQGGRTRVDDCRADRAGRLQLAGAIQPPSARRALRRLSVFPDRQAAGAGLRPEMEVDQSRGNGPRTCPLLGGAELAGSSAAPGSGIAMKTPAIHLAVAFAVASATAHAQGTNDPVTQLRACSAMEHAERLECLDKLSRDIAPALRQAPQADNGADNWIVSETTSPVDYTPIVTATASYRRGADGSSMQLSIHCRGGRTELVVTGPARHPQRRGLRNFLSHQRRATGAAGCSLAIVRNRRRVQGRCGAPVAVAPRRGRHRHPPLHPSGRSSRRVFLAQRTEDGARQGIGSVQMAARRIETTQLMVIKQETSHGRYASWSGLEARQRTLAAAIAALLIVSLPSAAQQNVRSNTTAVKAAHRRQNRFQTCSQTCSQDCRQNCGGQDC